MVYTVGVERKANSKQGDVKMKKRELSPIELKKVVELRQVGAKWTEIEHETKVERRAAKRAYEEWERDKKMREQEAARFRVAAEAFHEHLNDLIRLAGSLTSLSVPPSIADMEKNAEQFFSELWEQDLLQRGPLSSLDIGTGEVYTRLPQPLVDRRFSILENELLFKCLQDHTRSEGVRWEILEEWKKARDNCAKIVPKLRKETSVVVDNFLNQETNLLQRVKEESVERGNAVEQMAKAVLSAIWQGIREDKPDQIFVRMPSGSGRQGIVKVKDETFLIFNDTSLAEKVVHTCNLAVNNLRKGEMVQQLHSEVRKMEKATDKLRQMLNSVRLTPMILRTRCDLCPA
jgi:hypothetical protein